MGQSNWISVKDKLPEDDKYRLVLFEDGLHICQYTFETWIDRERYHYKGAIKWQELPK